MLRPSKPNRIKVIVITTAAYQLADQRLQIRTANSKIRDSECPTITLTGSRLPFVVCTRSSLRILTVGKNIHRKMLNTGCM